MKNLKRQKMLLALPLLVIPFLTMGFWALGGGKKTPSNNVTAQGLNLALPEPKLRDDRLADKLSFYDAADKDSLQRAEFKRYDPYYQEKDTQSLSTNELEQLAVNSAGKFNQRLNVSPYDRTTKAPEEKVMEKLRLL